MILILNELSFEAQFPHASHFQRAMDNLLRMRQRALEHGAEVFCGQTANIAQVSQDDTLWTAVHRLPMEMRVALVRWVSQGPFWQNERIHKPDAWLVCRDRLVTDTGVAETAASQNLGIAANLISIRPSTWLTSPLAVLCMEDDERPLWSSYIGNYWTVADLVALLEASAPPVTNWRDVGRVAGTYNGLCFLEGWMSGLTNQPFSRPAARQIIALLGVLNELASCRDEVGQRTAKGRELYEQYFTGSNSWFSDSSETEKAHSSEKMTFPHPTLAGEYLFCPFHGKIRSSVLRLHFSWPARPNEPIYVAYVGPKLTKH